MSEYFTVYTDAVTGVVTEIPWTDEQIVARQAYLASLHVSVPQSITRRQCAIELRERQMITAQEALDMTRTGQPPAMVQAVFDDMTSEQSIIAQTDFAADTYMRANPLLNDIMVSVGASEADIDQFFISAATR